MLLLRCSDVNDAVVNLLFPIPLTFSIRFLGTKCTNADSVVVDAWTIGMCRNDIERDGNALDESVQDRMKTSSSRFSTIRKDAEANGSILVDDKMVQQSAMEVVVV